MNHKIVYFDETGDDSLVKRSSDYFILTSIYIDSSKWNDNFERIKCFRKYLKDQYGFHVSEEMHTKHFLSDKDPYRKYNWTDEIKKEIIIEFAKMVASLDISCINVIIDKTRVVKLDYPILKNALKYNIQRIQNDSNGNWSYLIITDEGRVAPMRKTAREIRAFNPIHSKYNIGYQNMPIKDMIEDILEKDSKESYFIQICDYVSYFVHLYYKCCIKKENLPNRVGRLIDTIFVKRILATLRAGGILNLKANTQSAYGIVVYPK